MSDDLKAYVDGELPPDAAERLRDALVADPELARELEGFRDLSVALRALPSPETVGRAETLAALGRRREPLLRGWGLSLAGCAGALALAAFLSSPRVRPAVLPAGIVKRSVATPVEAELPAARREAFTRFVQRRGGEVFRDAEGLRATYPPSAHEELLRRFGLPEGTPWPAGGLRVRLEP